VSAASSKTYNLSGRAPEYEDIDVIVETARRWREAHPDGYGKADA
jgi:hypothetical protein